MASNHGGFVAANVGRSRPSFAPDSSQNSMASTNGNSDAAADLLREQQIERDRLQMENFNLMMRVAFLEERLAKTQSGYTEDFEAELLQARVDMEEKDAKIRSQKESIMTALGAIEGLQRDLKEARLEVERARAQSNQVEELETLRQILAKTEEELERQIHRARQAEGQLTHANNENSSLRQRYDEMDEVRRELESEVNQLRQKLQQFEVQHAKGALQVEHLQQIGSHRDQELQELSGRLNQIAQEKQQLETKYQNQLKNMEEQMREQVDKLRQETEKYRTEFMRVNGERDKVQFERERYVADLESVQQDKARYQAEWERLAKELDRMNADSEALRIQNAKLNATCEHHVKMLQDYTSDRENTADNLHKLESEANEWRKRVSEREVVVKTLEVRCQNTEAEVTRLQERLETVTTRQNQSASERLSALEQGKNSAETQNYELRMQLSTLQQQLESFESKCQSYEGRLAEESAKAKEYKAHLHSTETDLRQHMAHIEQLERQLAHATTSSQTEGTKLQEYSEQIHRLTLERNQLGESLTTERRRFEEVQRSHAMLEAQNHQLTQQFEALAREIQSTIGFGNDVTVHSLDALLKETRVTLQRQFKAEADTIARRYQEQVEIMRNHVDGLSSRLHSCHVKLEGLQRAGLHAKDDAKSIDRAWMMKYEQLRMESDAARRNIEESLRSEQYRSSQLETTVSQLGRELESVTERDEGNISDLKRDILDLKESNRLLLGELQERRRSAEHSRKQYLQAVAENKDLLSAVDILKNGIMERDKQIEFYKATILRTTQQLQRGGSMADVKQKLLEQLEQTQFMVNETYKKWSHSEMGGLDLNGFHLNGTNNGSSTAWVVQVDEAVGRLEVICDRWREYIQQSRDLQRRYGDAWRSAAISFGKGKDRPTWVDDVERKCGRLLTESVRVSEAMRDVVEDVVNALQQARSSSERKLRRSRSVDQSTRRRSSTRDRLGLSPLRENNFNDDALSLQHFEGDDLDQNGHQDNNDTHEVVFMSRGKRVSVTSGRSSRPSASRGAASAIYDHSLASLSRIGDELKTIEKKIKTYPDE